jgi:hypothetical protein
VSPLRSTTNLVVLATEQEKAENLPPLLPQSFTETARWLPTSLNRVYLFFLAILSIALGICCFSLVAYSHLHNGLSNANSSNRFKFNQRFLPTIVAVLYTLLWRPVVKDVVRTEPWALMSFPNGKGSKAQESILQGDKMWWSYLAVAVKNRKRPGGVRWALILAVVINPLSAGLFDTADLLVTEQKEFLGITQSTSVNQPPSPRIDDVTYLRAVTNLLFGVRTSAWSTEGYTVAPFWPSGINEAPLGPILASTPQLWKGNSDVLVSQIQCEPLKSVSNSTESYGSTVWKNLPFLKTDDGCGIITADYTDWCGGGVWDRINVSLSLERLSASAYISIEYYIPGYVG